MDEKDANLENIKEYLRLKEIDKKTDKLIEELAKDPEFKKVLTDQEAMDR